MTVLMICYAVLALCVSAIAWKMNRMSADLDRKAYRGELTTILADLAKTANEAHRRCSEALKSKSEHEDRIRELYERCNSLQAQINVAHRAAEHARGVR